MIILLLTTLLSGPPDLFAPTGIYSKPPEPVVAMTSGLISPRRSERPRAADTYVVVFVSRGCAPCERMKRDVIPELKRRGVAVRVIDTNGPEYEARWGVQLNPTIWICDRKTRKRKGKPIVGFASVSLLMSRVAPDAEPAAVTIQTVRERLPVVRTQWGTIDLETYSRNCNCPMCQGIRGLQAQYRQTAGRQVIPPDAPAVDPDTRATQQATPDLVIDRMLDLMRLTAADVLCDMGCGDGRILIEASRRYGVRGLGIEIDHEMADRARRRVAEVGLSASITIVTGDALEVDPYEYGTTAVVTYLYPELLERLAPKIRRARVAVSPWHEVPGLGMTEIDGVWVWRQ